MNRLILEMPSTMSSTLRRLRIPAVLAFAVDDAMSGPCSNDHTERLECLYCLRCTLPCFLLRGATEASRESLVQGLSCLSRGFPNRPGEFHERPKNRSLQHVDHFAVRYYIPDSYDSHHGRRSKHSANRSDAGSRTPSRKSGCPGQVAQRGVVSKMLPG